MSRPVVYFDNAATTYPKPEVVYKQQDEYFRSAANPGRGTHRLSLQSAKTVFDARLMLADLLGIKRPERLIFTPGCTYSINMALKGFPFEQGDVVLVSSLEHNAVMRPLRQLESSRGIKIAVLPYAEQGIVGLHALVEAMLRFKPRLCVLTEVSNVTGESIDLSSIAAICLANRVPLMIDAAQSAGASLHDFTQLGVSLWCASGHKGLLGPPGVGLLYVAPEVELTPLVAGGTGSHSEDLEMPVAYPDRLEAGSAAGPAIAGLGAAAAWLKETGIKNIIAAENALVEQFLDWALKTRTVSVVGKRTAFSTAVVSFSVPGVPCDAVAQILDAEFGIAVRSGLHCAAFAHGALGTLSTGLVRASFGYFNTPEQVDFFCNALTAIGAQAQSGTLR